MTDTVVLSVRLDPRTRRVLTEAAGRHDSAGASALARRILEEWAAQTLAATTEASLQKAVSYLRSHESWSDEPAEFFPDVES